MDYGDNTNGSPQSHATIFIKFAVASKQKDDRYFSLLGVWIFFISGVIAVLGDTLPCAIGPVRVTDFFLFCLIIQSFYNLLPSVFHLHFCVVVLSARRREVRRVMSPVLPDN